SPSSRPISSRRWTRASLPWRASMVARWPTCSWSRETMVRRFLGPYCGEGRSMAGQYGPDKNLHGAVAPEAQAAAANLEETRAPRLKDLHATAGPDAEMRHSADPGRLPSDFFHFGPFSRAE